MLKRKYLFFWAIITIYSLVLLSPYLAKQNLYEQNDLDEITFSLQYIKKSVIQDHVFPQWNPYANQGIPISADPLNTLFNPLLGLPFFVLDFSNAIKITYILVLIVSISSMYYTCRKLGVREDISFLISLTFASCGYVASRIVAAHFLVLSYPFLPLFFLALINMLDRKHVIWSVLIALVLTLMLFSADVYNVLYASFLLAATFAYALINKKLIRHFFLSFVFFFLFSAIKIIPLIELTEYLSKAKEPFSGSQNLVSIIYYIFIPIKPFFHAFRVSNFITTEFAWWEKIAFIGPLPLLVICFFLFKRKLFSKIKYNYLFLLLFLVLLGISMPNAFLNPFRYLITHVEILQSFHVPSRVFAMLTSLLLIITGVTLHTFLKQKANNKYYSFIILLLAINLLLTSSFFVSIFIFRSQPPSNTNFARLLTSLKTRDNSIYYIAQRNSQSPLPRYITENNEQKMLQNYALQLNNSPAEKYIQYDYNQIHWYTDIQPKYIAVEANKKNTMTNNATIDEAYKDVVLYKNTSYTPYAFIENIQGERKEIQLSSQSLLPNKIFVRANGEKKFDTLVLLESYYPGWKVYADGKQQELIGSRFLKTSVLPGLHTYTFVFHSPLFTIGATISLLAYCITTILCLTSWRRSIHRELSLKPS